MHSADVEFSCSHRCMTLNVDGLDGKLHALVDLIHEYKTDTLTLQGMTL